MASSDNSPKKDNNDSDTSDYLADMEKIVESLTLRAMAAGNRGNFKAAFSNMEVALWLSQNLKKKCLEAVMLNNMGLLYTLKGAWDKAMLYYDCSMQLAVQSCPSNDKFLATLKNNICCLFDAKIAPPKNPEDH